MVTDQVPILTNHGRFMTENRKLVFLSSELVFDWKETAVFSKESWGLMFILYLYKFAANILKPENDRLKK